MTVEMWYGRQPDNPAEQNILVDLNDYLRTQSEHFVVLSTFHAGRNEIDLLVLKPQAWFVAEIKHVWGKVVGSQEGHWECAQPDGSLKPLPSDNPYRQVRQYHHELRDWLAEKIHVLRTSASPGRPFDVDKFHPLQYIILYPDVPPDSQIDIKDRYVEVVDLNKFRTALTMRTSRGSDFTLEELQTVPQLLKLTRWQIDPPVDHNRESRITKKFSAADYQPPAVRMLVPREPGLSLSVFYFPDTQEPIRVGRESDCDLVIQHDSISRKHAEIYRDKDRWVVHDCGSRNGVYVAYNGDPSTERQVNLYNAIKNGSIVRFGQVSFTFLLNEG
jgi:hypothetical protein